jgi:hypothetical protein
MILPVAVSPATSPLSAEGRRARAGAPEVGGAVRRLARYR